MLPRCVRLEPFSIQKSIELDCEKSPQIDACKRDASPLCTNIIDVWGRAGKATIMWQMDPEAPVRPPLYFHVRYGQAQTQASGIGRGERGEVQGVAPFMSWQIMNRRDVKVKGNITWVSAAHAVPAQIHLYDRLFADPRPDGGDKDFLACLNPNSKQPVTAWLEPGPVASAGAPWQVERPA